MKNPRIENAITVYGLAVWNKAVDGAITDRGAADLRRHLSDVIEEELTRLGPLSCPACEDSAISTRNEKESFQCGSDGDAVTLIAEVPVRCCRGCGFEFLDVAGEIAKSEAAHTYVATQLKRAEQVLANFKRAPCLRELLGEDNEGCDCMGCASRAYFAARTGAKHGST